MKRDEQWVALPAGVVAAFPPCGQSLLTAAAGMVPDEMLVEISRADYGMDAGDHLSALRSIRDMLYVPAPLQSVPGEVLELTRWSKPWDPAAPGGDVARRGHAMRAFCCAALLSAAADPGNLGYMFVGDQNETLAPMIESALFLGDPFPSATAQFLTSRVPMLRLGDALLPFFAFGLLATCLLAKPAAASAADVDALVAFVDESETAVRDPLRVCTPAMLGGSFLNVTCHNQRHKLWRRLAVSLRTTYPDNARLVRLSNRVAGDLE